MAILFNCLIFCSVSYFVHLFNGFDCLQIHSPLIFIGINSQVLGPKNETVSSPLYTVFTKDILKVLRCRELYLRS